MSDKKVSKTPWVMWSFVVVIVIYMVIMTMQFKSVDNLSDLNEHYKYTMEKLKTENKRLGGYEEEALQLRNENDSLSEKMKSLKAVKRKNEELSGFIMSLQPKLDIEVSNIIAAKIIEHANAFGFPPSLIASLMYRESSFNLIAVSSAKCVGLMQVNPAAHTDKIEDMGLEYHNLFSIDENIKLGCMILYEYYSSEKDIRKALTRYVGGSHDNYVNDILSMYSNYQINEFGKNKEQ